METEKNRASGRQLPAGLTVTAPCSERQFEHYFELRWRILREPWQQPRGSEQDEHEAGATHRMILDAQGQTVAVGRLHSCEPGIGQIRYMAVDPAYQGQGLGRQILEALEAAARQQHLHTLFLNAREPVIGFYLQHGYQLKQPTETLFGVIPHYRMEKNL